LSKQAIATGINWRDNVPALAIAALGAIAAASLFYTPLPFVLLLAIPASLYFASRPYELLLVMIFLIPFNFIFSIGPIPVAAELLKVVAWIPFVIHGDNGSPFKTSKYNKWFGVWAGIILLSIFRSNDLPFTVKESVRLASNLGLVYLVLNLVDTREKVLQVLRVLSVSTFLVACYGFYQWAIQGYGPLFWIVNARDAVDSSLAPGHNVFWDWRDRIISTLTSEMELGHYFNLCLPIAVALWLTEGRQRVGSRWLLISLAMLAGLVLTFTFGAWLALAAAIFLFALLVDKKRNWKIILAGVLVLSLAASVLVFGPLRPFVEAKVLGSGMASLAWDIMTRLDAWVFALQVWWSHPLIGVGVGSYQALEYAHEYVHSPWAPNGSTPHQTYLYLLAQSGILGLGSMLIILLGTIRMNLNLRAHPEWGMIALALAFAVTVNMFGWFADDTFFGAHEGYLVWLLVGLSESVRNLSLRQGSVPTA
jgi:O-antigen ligase